MGNRNTTSQKLHRTKSQSVENTSDHNVGNILNRTHSSSSQKQLLPGGGDSIRRYARNMNRLYFLHELHEAGYLKSPLFKGYTSGSNTTQPFICVWQCLRIPGIKSRKQLGLKTHLWIPNQKGKAGSGVQDPGYTIPKKKKKNLLNMEKTLAKYAKINIIKMFASYI